MMGKDASGTYNAGSVWKMENGKWLAIFHTNIKQARSGTRAGRQLIPASRASNRANVAARSKDFRARMQTGPATLRALVP